MIDPAQRLHSALEGLYKVERELGAGGMATVYLAEDLKHQRDVAVKVLKPELAAIIGAERFLTEIRTTANLRHPHILPLFDSGEEDGLLYYVMPFVEGESLRARIDRERQLPVDEAVRIATSVAAALDHAHRHDVIHRDIKPGNILFQDSEPLLADFGIALAVGEAGGGRLTETGLSVGTPYYMSPEQATGERAVDARSDVYSLGCILYEMLTGEPPHTGNSAQALLVKMLSETPLPVRRLREMVPPNVDAALRMALARTPADRFTTAAQFAEALSNPSFAVPETVVEGSADTRTAAPRNRLTGVLAGLTAVLTATTLWAMWRPEAPRPVLKFSLALPVTQALDPTQLRSRLASSPDGSRLVYVSRGEDDVPRLWVRSRDELHATPVAGTEGAHAPFFSPDGSRVGYHGLANGQAVLTFSLGGGAPIAVVDSLVGSDGSSWGTDGFIYYDGITAGGTRGIMRVAESGGLGEQVTTVDTTGGETDHVWPDVLPSAKGLIVTVMHGAELSDAEVAVADTKTGTLRALVRGVRGKYSASGHLMYVTADGTLMVAPFDQDRLELSGEAVTLAQGVSVRPNASVDLSVSDTGTLVFTAGALVAEPSEMVWVDRTGAVQQVDPSWVGDFRAVALSPDGTEAVVSVVEGGAAALQQLFVKRLPRGPVSTLTAEGNRNFRQVWTRDGTSVLFVSNRGGSFDLYMRRADGSVPAEPLIQSDSHLGRSFFSPDGTWLVYQEGEGLYGKRTDGVSETRTLLDGGFVGSTPRLSPDGNWLAYVSRESGQSEVHVRPFPNTSDGRWPISTGGGTEPLWAHSGKELFYRNPERELIAVDVTPGSTFQAGEQRILFTAPSGVVFEGGESYALSPEDDRFLMIRDRGTELDFEVIVVENFFEELAGLFGGG